MIQNKYLITAATGATGSEAITAQMMWLNVLLVVRP